MLKKPMPISSCNAMLVNFHEANYLSFNSETAINLVQQADANLS